MVFVKNGKTEFQIAYQSGNDTAEFSANELKSYLEKCIGSEVRVIGASRPIAQKAFYIGIFPNEERKKEIENTHLNGDGFVLDIYENQIFLNAKV